MSLVQAQQSDLAALWEEALSSYSDVAKVDIRRILSAKRSITTIMVEQHQQLESFKAFRHDKGKLDRFRTMISSNADIIQGMAKPIADAASAAFPPSSAILTAFTLVMSASKHVSEDYDMIEGFFVIMQSLLQRLSLLENKIPPQKAFQMFLVNVFSSLLQLSALARSYCAKGRLSKWARALVDGKDPELNAAYATLNDNIQKLESATIIQTLRTTIEISEEARATNQKVKVVQGLLAQTTTLTRQTLETSEQTLVVTMRTDAGVQELVSQSRDSADASTELLRRQDDIVKRLDKMYAQENKDRRMTLKSGASRPVNFDCLVTDYLTNPALGGLTEKPSDLEDSYIDSLFDWIDEDIAFQHILDNEERLLCISGAPGMGKSTLSFRMLRYMKEKYSFDASTCVAWFSFDEDHTEMRSLRNMLECCAIQVAEKDARYCSEILMYLRRFPIIAADQLWVNLFKTRFSKGSDRRLILILDGIDEMKHLDLLVMVDFLSSSKKALCNIQVICTCDPGQVQDLASLNAEYIDLSRDKVLRDMHQFAWAKTRSLSRLRKLKAKMRKTIVRKVTEKADSFLYIGHTMRKLNALGREKPIRTELDNLPQDTRALYRMLLEECQKNRTPEDRELLRDLLAWLAYAQSKFTVAEADLLIEIIKRENSMNIEEELDGRLARLLRISGDRAEIVQHDSSSDENENENEMTVEDNSIESVEDTTNFLGFQERSLKAYFCEAIHDHTDGLRCTATEAHIITFRTCSAILASSQKFRTRAGCNLEAYASQWIFFHLLEIDPEDKSGVSDDLANNVIEGLFNIFTNKNDSLSSRWRSAQAIVPPSSFAIHPKKRF